MLEHIQILSFILLLFSWAWLIFYINHIYKTYSYTYIKAIKKYNVYVILLFALRFVSIYLLKNLNPEVDSKLIHLYNNIIELSVSVLMILLVYLMVNILLCFRGKSFTKNQNSWILAVSFLIILFYTFRIFIPDTAKFFTWLDYLKDNFKIFNILINNIELIILVLFYFLMPKSSDDSGKIRISRIFALFYIICNILAIVALLFFEWYEISEITEWIFKTIILFLFLLAPYIWLKFIFLDYAQKMLRLINADSNLHAVYSKYKISKREIEIIELIIDGKSNYEISDLLFISYHTVKNHLANIYQKLNVKTRHELIHFFIKRK